MMESWESLAMAIGGALPILFVGGTIIAQEVGRGSSPCPQRGLETKGGLTKEDIYNCLKRYEEHKRMLTEGEPSALRLQRILEACYPGDQDKQEDLWCALVMDIGTGFAPIGKIMRAFKRWDVEEAFDCPELKDLFRPPEIKLEPYE